MLTGGLVGGRGLAVGISLPKGVSDFDHKSNKMCMSSLI